MNRFVLSGSDWKEDFSFNYLPALMEHYCSRLETILKRRPDANKIELQGPEVAVLTIYVKAVTGESPYLFVKNLLQAAYECVGLEFAPSQDAIPKRVKRYEKEHPHTFARIEELVESHVAGLKEGKEAKTDFALLIYENLYATNDPRVDDIVRRP